MNTGLCLAIDASNLRRGGGATHLVELLAAADPGACGFERVVVWGSSATVESLPQRGWLERIRVPALDRSLVQRIAWQSVQLSRLARSASADVLFSPGGSYAGTFRPFVTMSRNLLPFDARASRRYGVSLMRIKLAALRRAQTATFRRSDGVVFLTNTARQTVEAFTGPLRAPIALIPHGVSPEFLRSPGLQEPITSYSFDRPFSWLYVSTIDMYKHQQRVAQAALQLHQEGFPLRVSFVGHAYPPALKELEAVTLSSAGRQVVRYVGAVPHKELREWYHRAEGFVFASSCENLPNSLVEAMAARLPIACSNRSVMPEVAGSAAIYFDPEDVPSIAAAMRRLMNEPGLRRTLTDIGAVRAAGHSWSRCARETFGFLGEVARAADPGRPRGRSGAVGKAAVA